MDEIAIINSCNRYNRYALPLLDSNTRFWLPVLIMQRFETDKDQQSHKPCRMACLKIELDMQQ